MHFQESISLYEAIYHGVTKHNTVRTGLDIGLSAIYLCRYLTFSNSQQTWQCQDVLTAGCTIHLSLLWRIC